MVQLIQKVHGYLRWQKRNGTKVATIQSTKRLRAQLQNSCTLTYSHQAVLSMGAGAKFWIASMIIFGLVSQWCLVSQVILTCRIPEPEPFCCEHCALAPCLSCCDLCDPKQTESMNALDLPPKASRRWN